MNIPSDEDIALMDERLNGLKPFDGLIRDYTPVTKNDQIDALIVEFSNVLDIGHHKEGGRYLECNFKTESFKERGGFT